FRCWGGDLMEKQGAKLVKHYKDLAFMGFLEVLLHLRTILRNIKFCKQDLLAYKADVLILVDYPGFNMRIADFAHKNGIKIFYYISPQIWAWKKSRVHKIKKTIDKMFVILPFEEEFYKKYDYKVDFVGHPLLDSLDNKQANGDFKNFSERNNLNDRPIIALLPGSRKQEIKVMLKIMLEVVEDFKEYQFVIGAAPSVSDDFYQGLIADFPVNIVYDQLHDLLANSSAALVTSGTATLETALMETPEVVCYKGNYISYLIARKIVDIKYISLVNLIMDKEVVKELIQSELNHSNLKKELDLLLNNKENRNRMLEDFKQLKQKLGGSGASAHAAKLMLSYLDSKKSNIAQS
ncbi:lipid-A-disaccharide synthase, partial [Bacteroidota bacterium]